MATALELLFESFVLRVVHAPDLIGKSHLVAAPAGAAMALPPEHPEKQAGDQEKEEHLHQEEGQEKSQGAKKHAECDRSKK